MKKKGHIILGLLLSFLFIYMTIYLGFSLFSINFYSIFIISLIIVLYSLLPDIDHKNSTMTWWFFGIGLLGLVFGIIELVIGAKNPSVLVILIISTLFLAITFIAGNFMKHRGFMHSIPAGIIAVFPIWLLGANLAYCVIAYVAWHSHLIGDGFLIKMK